MKHHDRAFDIPNPRVFAAAFAAAFFALALFAAPAGAREFIGWKAEVEYKLATGDFPGAMTLLKAQEQSGETLDEDYYFLLGKASSATGKVEEAIKHLDKALSIDPKYAEALGHKAVVMLQLGKPKDAERIAGEAIATAPSGELYYARGAIYMALGRYDDAIRDLDSAIGYEPENSEYHIARGEVRLRIGRGEAAEKDYARAIELDSENAKAYLGRGGLALVRNDLASARIDLDHCVRLAPNFSSCYLRRGKMFQMRGETDRGLADYAKATELAPDSSEAWFERAMAELELGRANDAEKSARKIAAVEPGPRAQKVLGMVLSAQNREAEALLAFDEAIKHDDKDFETWYLRGAIHAMGKQWDKAIADFDRSIALEGRYLDAWVAKAGVYLAQDQNEKALDIYNGAIAKAPNSAQLYKLRADLYDAMGRYEDSLADLKRAKEIAAQKRESR
ncbi:tetratricopeptide repeat protein [bacterium]|nr:tetratricopeptide repeat protein [bacterium]